MFLVAAGVILLVVLVSLLVLGGSDTLEGRKILDIVGVPAPEGSALVVFSTYSNPVMPAAESHVIGADPTPAAISRVGAPQAQERSVGESKQKP